MVIVGCFLLTYFCGVELALGGGRHLTYQLSAARRFGPRKPNSHAF